MNSPYWAEQFDLYLYADQSKVLEITLCGINQSGADFINKTCVDLSELAIEKSHKLVKKFETSLRSIEIVIAITGSHQNPSSIISNNFNCSMVQSKTYVDICRKYVRSLLVVNDS